MPTFFNSLQIYHHMDKHNACYFPQGQVSILFVFICSMSFTPLQFSQAADVGIIVFLLVHFCLLYFVRNIYNTFIFIIEGEIHALLIT